MQSLPMRTRDEGFTNINIVSNLEPRLNEPEDFEEAVVAHTQENSANDPKSPPQMISVTPPMANRQLSLQEVAGGLKSPRTKKSKMTILCKLVSGDSNGSELGQEAQSRAFRSKPETLFVEQTTMPEYKGCRRSCGCKSRIEQRKQRVSISEEQDSNLKHRLYDLKSKNRGEFCFKSEDEFQQPEYPLKFFERDLKLQLDLDEFQRQKVQSTKQTNVLRFAMRAKIIQKAFELRQSNQTKIGETQEDRQNRIVKYQQIFNKNSSLNKLINSVYPKNQPKTIDKNEPMVSYQLNKVRYYDDHKLPFQLVKDVPKIIESYSFKQLNLGNFGREKRAKVSTSQEEIVKSRLILKNFYKQNEAGMSNIVVYLFWIVHSVIFQDFDHMSFPTEFVDEIKETLRLQYKQIYFNYLLRLKRHSMDAITEILPFWLTDTIKSAISIKLKNHDLPLNNDKTFVILFQIVFYELYGYALSEICVLQGKQRFILDHNVLMPTKVNQNLQSSASVMAKRKQRFKTLNKYDSQETFKLREKKPIFEASTYKLKKDPKDRFEEDRRKLYTQEIKQDLVNEMIAIFDKGASKSVKQTISDQINEMSDVEAPDEVLGSKTKAQGGGMRLQSQTNFNLGSRRNTSFIKRQTSATKIKAPLTRNQSNNWQKTQNVVKGNYLSQSSLKTIQVPKPSSKEELDSIVEEYFLDSPMKPRANTVYQNKPNKKIISRQESQMSRVESLQKQKSEHIQISPSKKNLNHYDSSLRTVSVLKNIIKKVEAKDETVNEQSDEVLQKMQRRVQSAMSESQSRQQPNHMHLNGRKWQTGDSNVFDLQYLSPMLRDGFSNQMVSCHHPARQQKSLLCLKESSSTKPDNYQQTIKKFLKDKEAENVRKKKQREIDNLKAEQERTKALMSSQTQSSMQYTYAMEAQSTKLMVANEQKAAQEIINAKKQQEADKQRPSGKREFSPNQFGARDQLFQAPNDCLATTMAGTKQDGLSRNVQFEAGEGLENHFSVQTMQTSRMFKSHDVPQRPPRNVQSAMNVHKQQFFFQDKEYFDAQKTWELQKEPNKKKPRKKQQTSDAKMHSTFQSMSNFNMATIDESPTLKLQQQNEFNHGDAKSKVGKSSFYGIKVSKLTSSADKLPTGDSDQKMSVPISMGEKSYSQKASVILPRSRFNSTAKKSTISRQSSQLNLNKGRMSSQESQIELEAPFSSRDLGMQITRKTSKIIREGKSVLTKDKVPPMAEQYFNYIKQFPDKVVSQDKKKIEEEVVRKRIDDSMPQSIAKQSNWIKKRPPPGYLSDKHTYSTMRKVSSHKSRKLFIFDGYTAKQQLEDEEIKKENKPENSQVASDSKKSEQDEVTELKAYHVFKGSNFEDVPREEKKQLQDKHQATNSQKRQYMKPPKPIANKKNAMLHTMKYKSQTQTTEISECISESSGKQQMNKERNEFGIWMKQISKKNELDDQADVRDGIAETKGKAKQVNGDYRASLRLVPHEQNTKVYKMLKQLRGFIQQEQVQEEEMKDKQKQAADDEIVDSDDERERLQVGQDHIVARPNPLEPQPKQNKPLKQSQSNKDSKSGPQQSGRSMVSEYSDRFSKQKQKARDDIPELRLFDRNSGRSKHHFD